MHILLPNYTKLKKTLGQFENLVFVIMSTRENICLIARTPWITDSFMIRFCNHKIRECKNKLRTKFETFYCKMTKIREISVLKKDYQYGARGAYGTYHISQSPKDILKGCMHS